MEIAATRLVFLLTVSLLAPGVLVAQTVGEWTSLAAVTGIIVGLALGAERQARDPRRA